MSEIPTAQDQYKTFGRTIWQKTRPPKCLVESLLPPPEELEKTQSCGREFVKGVDPQFAADLYRTTKKLPEDWPVKVTVKDSDGKAVSTHILPEPEQPDSPLDLPASLNDESPAPVTEQEPPVEDPESPPEPDGEA